MLYITKFQLSRLQSLEAFEPRKTLSGWLDRQTHPRINAPERYWIQELSIPQISFCWFQKATATKLRGFFFFGANNITPLQLELWWESYCLQTSHSSRPYSNRCRKTAVKREISSCKFQFSQLLDECDDDAVLHLESRQGIQDFDEWNSIHGELTNSECLYLDALSCGLHRLST